MVSTSIWNLATLDRWTVRIIWHQNVPSTVRLLESVEIKCNEIVEKIAFDLTSENVDLGA